MLVYTLAHINFKIAIVEVTLKYYHTKILGKFLPYNKHPKAHLLFSVLGLIQGIPKNKPNPSRNQSCQLTIHISSLTKHRQFHRYDTANDPSYKPGLRFLLKSCKHTPFEKAHKCKVQS